jgi:hypothetical protein
VRRRSSGGAAELGPRPRGEAAGWAWGTYRVDGALEVLRGVVGEEDEEERRAQQMHVAGGRRRRRPAGAGAGDQGRGGLLDVAGGCGDLCFGRGHGGVGNSGWAGEFWGGGGVRSANSSPCLTACDLGNARTAGWGLEIRNSYFQSYPAGTTIICKNQNDERITNANLEYADEPESFNRSV